MQFCAISYTYYISERSGLVGAGFSAGQMAYDAWVNTIWPQFVQFENALNSGWRPSR